MNTKKILIGGSARSGKSLFYKNYAYIFYQCLKQEYERAGRTDYKECMIDLCKGDATRFTRELGVKPKNLNSYRIIMKGNLNIAAKYQIQQEFFKDLLDQVGDELN